MSEAWPALRQPPPPPEITILGVSVVLLNLHMAGGNGPVWRSRFAQTQGNGRRLKTRSDMIWVRSGWVIF